MAKVQFNLESKKEFLCIIVFFLGYGVCYLGSGIGDFFTVTIRYWISELNQEVSFEVTARDLIEIFLAGPVFSISAWILFEKIFLDEKSASQEILSSRIITALKIIFFLAIGTMCIGNAVHIIVDDLNARAFNIAEIQTNPLYADLYFTIYFWDEFFGHLAVFVPLFVLMGIFMGGLLLESPSRSLRWFEWLFITLIGIGYGIGWFHGFAEGQATFVICLINLFLIIFILVAILNYHGLKAMDS